MAVALESWKALGTSVHVVATDADGLGRARSAVSAVLEDVDTAFDAASIRQACDKRKYTWIVPLNPERVLAGPKGKRPKVRSLVNGLKADQLLEIRLHAGKGPYVEQRRVSPWRVGSKVKPRT